MIDATAMATEILRNAGFPTVFGSLGAKKMLLSIDGEDATEVKAAAEFMANAPGASIKEQPFTDSDGFTWAMVQLPA